MAAEGSGDRPFGVEDALGDAVGVLASLGESGGRVGRRILVRRPRSTAPLDETEQPGMTSDRLRGRAEAAWIAECVGAAQEG